jgi:SNF2 family DNA or RNA helicase
VLYDLPHVVDDPFTKVDSSAAELAKIVLDNAAKGFERMQAGGHLDALLRQATGVSKAPGVAALVKMIAEQEEKIVLFGWHRAVYDLWAELLEDLRPAWYTGHESPAKKRAETQSFIEGDARVLIMSLRSGLGLEGLQKVCATAVHGELDWSPGVHEQCNGRLQRDGQTRPVFAYYPIVDDGSDPVVVDVLGIKRAQVEGLRDPHGAPVISRQVDPDHIKKLAEHYLRRRR